MTLLAASNSKEFWYLTRGTGVVALLLLTVVLVLGIAGTVRWQRPGWPRFLVADLHKHLTLLSIVFIAAHVVTTVADGFAPIRLLDAIVPFASPYRPIWLGLGTVAFDLLLALLVTSLVRARIGYGSWRVIHFLAYAAWPVALVHAFGTGSDGRTGWFALFGFGCAAAVGLAVAVRVLHSDRSRRSPRACRRRNRRRRANGLLLVPRWPGAAGMGGTGRNAVFDPSPTCGASDDDADGARADDVQHTVRGRPRRTARPVEGRER